METVLWNPATFSYPHSYPKSLALLYDAIGYEGWVGYPDSPVSVDSVEARAQVREVAGRKLKTEATQEGRVLFDAYVIDPRARSPLYYNAFRIPGPLLRRLGVLDRLEAYVVLSAASSLLLFGLGLLALVRARLGDDIVLLYGLVALVPYSVGVVASCSNYSLAIGIGQFLAACLVVGSPGRLPTHDGFTRGALLGRVAWSESASGTTSSSSPSRPLSP